MFSGVTTIIILVLAFSVSSTVGQKPQKARVKKQLEPCPCNTTKLYKPRNVKECEKEKSCFERCHIDTKGVRCNLGTELAPCLGILFNSENYLKLFEQENPSCEDAEYGETIMVKILKDRKECKVVHDSLLKLCKKRGGFLLNLLESEELEKMMMESKESPKDELIYSVIVMMMVRMMV